MNEVYFTLDIDYDMKALSDIVYNIDKENKWDGYISPAWDEKK